VIKAEALNASIDKQISTVMIASEIPSVPFQSKEIDG